MRRTISRRSSRRSSCCPPASRCWWWTTARRTERARSPRGSARASRACTCCIAATRWGSGSAYVAGFRYALEHGFDLVFEMDADLSHDPGAIPDFLKAIEQAPTSCVGSRYLNGVTVVNWPLSRLFLCYGANLYTRIITGLPLHDATGGFKCFRRACSRRSTWTVSVPTATRSRSR